MRYKNLLYFVPIAIVLLFFWGIGSIVLQNQEDSPVFKYIPQEVSHVIQINPTKIFKKFAFQRVFREKETLERIPNADERFSSRIEDDPGIDLFSPILLMKENWATGDVWMMVLAISNKDKFETFIKSKEFDENILMSNNEEVALFAIPFGPSLTEVKQHLDNIVTGNFKPLSIKNKDANSLLSVEEDITFLLTNKKYSENSIFELIQGKACFENEKVNINATLEARDVIPYKNNEYYCLSQKGLHFSSVIPPEEILPFILPENISIPQLPKAQFISMNIIGVEVKIMGNNDSLSQDDYTITPMIEALILPEDQESFEAFLNKQVADSLLMPTEKVHTYNWGYQQNLNIRPFQDNYYYISTIPHSEIKARLQKMNHVAVMNIDIKEIFNQINVKMPKEGVGIVNTVVERTISKTIERQMVGFENLKKFEFFVDPSDQTHLKAHGSFYFDVKDSHSIVELIILLEELDRLHLF